jgi:hypothetical protein
MLEDFNPHIGSCCAAIVLEKKEVHVKLQGLPQLIDSQ